MSMFFQKSSDEESEEFFPKELNETSDSDVDDTEGNMLLRIQKLKKELQACTKERKEYLDGWQRIKADYLNSKKRHDEERIHTIARAEVHFIEKLLPLCDSFDMAREHIGASDTSTLATGFTQIHSQLLSILSASQVTEISAEGEPFDPNKHEALSSTPVDAPEKNDTVVRVLQKGYMHGDVLLRPAKVIIGTFTG